MADTHTAATPVAAPVPAAQAHKNENAAAVEGARSVADAVTKLANAAVIEVQKGNRTPAPEIVATGTPGGRFKIRSVRAGTTAFGASGSVLLNGKAVETTGWSSMQIEGKLPSDAKSGEIVVWVDPETQHKGYLTL